MLTCEVYAVTTIIITTLWIWNGRTYSLRTLSWAMFFPGLFVPWFNTDPYIMEQILGYNNFKSSVIFSVASVLYVIVIMALVFVINYLTGWGTKSGNCGNKVQRTGGLLVGLLKVIGEEVGWRCYLLPCLLQKYNNIVAIFISGIIWALYHIPIMVLLTKRFSVHHRWKTVSVQALQCLLSAYPFSYVAIHSQFSLWPSVVMHFTWNALNPLLYGSIYSQQCGYLLYGDQWLINGEGLADVWLALPLVVVVLFAIMTT